MREGEMVISSGAGTLVGRSGECEKGHSKLKPLLLLLWAARKKILHCKKEERRKAEHREANKQGRSRPTKREAKRLQKEREKGRRKKQQSLNQTHIRTIPQRMYPLYGSLCRSLRYTKTAALSIWMVSLCVKARGKKTSAFIHPSRSSDPPSSRLEEKKLTKSDSEWNNEGRKRNTRK